MFIYSAIKMNANKKDAYSVLNPETSSLSPSARSNGARLVSANIVANQIIPRGGMISNMLNGDCRVYRFRVPGSLTNDKRVKTILTSYEMVCAIARTAPNRAYFELDLHPPPMIV